MGKKNNNKKNLGSTALKWIAGILAVVIVLGLAAVNMLNGSGFVLRSKTAAKSDNYKVTGTEMAYFASTYYQQFYTTYYNIITSLIDPNTSLRDQSCALDLNGGSWYDYFMNAAKSSVTQMLAFSEYAKENGIELDSEDKETVKAGINAIAENAAEASYDTATYIRLLFKNGMKQKDVEGAIKLSLLASKAQNAFNDSIEITADDKNAYYEEHPEEFEGVDYYSYTVTIPTSSNENSDEEKTEEEQSAEVIGMLAFVDSLTKTKTGEEFMTLVRSYESSKDASLADESLDSKAEATKHTHVLRANISDEEVASWLFEAKAGDTRSFTSDDNTSYTIVLLDKPSYRDDTMNRDVRHILISIDDEAENGDDDAKAQADDILAQLSAADFSEEKWNELAEEYSVDGGSNKNGGLYEGIVHGQTYTEFDAWLFDEARQAGDSDVIKTAQGGYHVIYYVGESDTAAWINTAENLIRNQKFDEMIEKYSASVVFDEKVINSIAITDND